MTVLERPEVVVPVTPEVGSRWHWIRLHTWHRPRVAWFDVIDPAGPMPAGVDPVLWAHEVREVVRLAPAVLLSWTSPRDGRAYVGAEPIFEWEHRYLPVSCSVPFVDDLGVERFRYPTEVELGLDVPKPCPWNAEVRS